MQQKIFDLLLKEEDITWKTIIYELVRTEQMNPWDIDITLLTQKYIKTIQELQKHDLKLSGKILLAAAILLKIKSTHLVDNDIANLDRLIHQTEEAEGELLDLSDEEFNRLKQDKEKYTLIPRNPQPRSRKVSIHDLIDALQKAMESKKRILAKLRPVKFDMPHRKMDVVEVIRDIYHKIVYYTNKKGEEKITFTQLLPPKAGKQEKVYTFIPLLHLENQHKILTEQQKPFEEIFIQLTEKNKNTP